MQTTIFHQHKMEKVIDIPHTKSCQRHRVEAFWIRHGMWKNHG